jgi:hypothetical protein
VVDATRRIVREAEVASEPRTASSQKTEAATSPDYSI